MSESIPQPTTEAMVALSRAVTTARLLSGVVHEINNALLVISGTAELLEARSDLPEPVMKAVDRIKRQTGRTASAIAQVTAFTHAIPGERVTVELSLIAQAAVELRRYAISRAGLSVQFVAAEEPSRVRGNGGELQQMVLNMIIHAEQALAAADRPAESRNISVETGRADQSATLRLSLPRTQESDSADDLFTPFAATRAAADTSGLGLFAARAIAMSHGGTLTHECDDAWTTLVVRLPAVTGERR